MVKEEKRWYTVTEMGKHETIIKHKPSWENMGYQVKENETEVLLMK
jgi:hypothetical protein